MKVSSSKEPVAGLIHTRRQGEVQTHWAGQVLKARATSLLLTEGREGVGQQHSSV